MRSRTVHPFRKLLAALPQDVRRLARDNYQLWKENPYHPSIKFERKKGSSNIYSARVGDNHRALCYVEDETAKWFWIGSHASYDHLLNNLKAVARGQAAKAPKKRDVE